MEIFSYKFSVEYLEKGWFTFFVTMLFNVCILLSGFLGWKFQYIFNCITSLSLGFYLSRNHWPIKVLALMAPLMELWILLNAKNLSALPIVIFQLIPLILFFILPFRTKIKYYVFLVFLTLMLLAYTQMEVWYAYAKKRAERKLTGMRFPQMAIVNNRGLAFSDMESDTASIFVLSCWDSKSKMSLSILPWFERIQKRNKYTKLRFYTLNLPGVNDRDYNLAEIIKPYYSLSNNLFANNLHARDSLHCATLPLFILVRNHRILQTVYGEMDTRAGIFKLYDKMESILKGCN